MKKKIIWIILILAVLIFGYIVYALIFRTCCSPKPVPIQIKDNIIKEQRLADPNLFYASMWWAGMCTNEKHEAGGCYSELYLYADGKFIKMSGFVKYNEESGREEEPGVQKQLSSTTTEQIKKMIRDSEVMTKDCSPEHIMDVGWDYQINLDGAKKSFHNSPSDCRDFFDQIDNLLNSVNGDTRAKRLKDPNLVYASMFSSGMCGNREGEQGGCYTNIYLYGSGELVKESGFIYSDNSQEIDPTIVRNFTSSIVEQIVNKIKDSGVMKKDCPETIIEDAGYDYQANLDGVKKSFSNPPSDCRDTFDEVDNLINAILDYKE